MPKKKSLIPKIDLSSKVSGNRLDTQTEFIITNGLIVFDCDTKKVAKHFNIDEKIVSDLLFKYYSYLSKIQKSKSNNIETDKILEDALYMYGNHISELKECIDKSKTKNLPYNTTSSINSIVDRVVKVKEQGISAYSSTVSQLNNVILNSKRLEVLEGGKVEDVSDYLQNAQTFYEKINNNRRPIKITNNKTKEVLEFNSMREAVDYLHSKDETLRKHIKEKTIFIDKFKNEWIVEDLNND